MARADGGQMSKSFAMGWVSTYVNALETFLLLDGIGTVTLSGSVRLKTFPLLNNPPGGGARAAGGTIA